MPAKQLMEYLERNEVGFELIWHDPTYSSQKTAQTAHVPGKELVKAVMVRLDGKAAMAVLTAEDKLDMARMKAAAHAETVALLTEREFKDLFPECEIGAMPPFGNLFNLPVFVDMRLTEDEEIVFNAGTHTELMRLPFREYNRLVKPSIAPLAMAR